MGPSRVEFLQGSPDRQHLRIIYTYDGARHLDTWRGEARVGSPTAR